MRSLGQEVKTTGQELVSAGQQGAKFGQEITKGMQPLQNAFSGAQTGMQKLSRRHYKQQSTFRLNGSLDSMGRSSLEVNSGFIESGGAIEKITTNTGRFEQGLQSISSETFNCVGWGNSS